VEAFFDIASNKPLQEKVAEMGFAAGDELVIRRVISHTGKKQSVHQRANGDFG